MTIKFSRLVVLTTVVGSRTFQLLFGLNFDKLKILSTLFPFFNKILLSLSLSLLFSSRKSFAHKTTSIYRALRFE